jgi:type III pantothenate kinase
MGLIQTLLDAVLAELAARGEPPAPVLASGGATAIVRHRLRQPVQDLPDLTLRGLAAAWALNHPTAVS